MKLTKNEPPRMALVLLNKCLPDPVNENISGDLIEEFNHSNHTLFKSKYRFWLHTLSTCWRYNMNAKMLISLVLSLLAMSIFYLMLLAITFLAYGDADAFNALDNDYWTSGAIHLFFVEPIFWQTWSGELLSQATLGLFSNTPAILWSVTGLIILIWLDRRYKLHLKTYSYIALALLTSPYLWGVLYFNLNTVPLKESGPIVAFMWSSILFLVLPLTVGLIIKIYQKRSTVLA